MNNLEPCSQQTQTFFHQLVQRDCKRHSQPLLLQLKLQIPSILKKLILLRQPQIYINPFQQNWLRMIKPFYRTTKRFIFKYLCWNTFNSNDASTTDLLINFKLALYTSNSTWKNNSQTFHREHSSEFDIYTDKSTRTFYSHFFTNCKLYKTISQWFFFTLNFSAT